MRKKRAQSGFALLLVFALMSAAAILMYSQLPRFVMQAQREKEQLLIDRGEQYQRAIQLYYRKLKTYPQTMDDLEKGNNTRFLRRKYVDPFTGKAEWRIVHMSNGQYTDSLVYNSNPANQKEKAQTFVAEIPSIGTNGADAQGDDNPNAALKARGSDRSRSPLDDLPEELRAHVYLGSLAPRDGTRPQVKPEDDVQYANGATAPTAGVFGAGAIQLNGFPAIQPGNSAPAADAAPDANTPRPGVGGISFEEIQRRAAEEAASGNARPSLPVPGNSFIGQTPTGQPYAPPVTNGAAGLSYDAIGSGAPPVPGSVVPGGFPGAGGATPPPAPAFGPAPNLGNTAGSSFIGGQQVSQGGPIASPYNQASAGVPGIGAGGVPTNGFGATPGGGSTNTAASQMIGNLLTTPRQQQGTPAGSMAGGSGIVGVASKYRGETVKVYREKSRYQLWEFVYDPAKDTSGRKPGAQAGAPLPGGLPSGGLPGGSLPGASLGALPPSQTAIQPFGGGSGTPTNIVPGMRIPTPPNQTGGGANTNPAPNTNRGGGGFIGGGFIGGGAAPVGNTGPIGIPNNGQGGGTGTGTQPTVPTTPPPPPPGGGPFIGGR